MITTTRQADLLATADLALDSRAEHDVVQAAAVALRDTMPGTNASHAAFHRLRNLLRDVGAL